MEHDSFYPRFGTIVQLLQVSPGGKLFALPGIGFSNIFSIQTLGVVNDLEKMFDFQIDTLSLLGILKERKGKSKNKRGKKERNITWGDDLERIGDFKQIH